MILGRGRRWSFFGWRRVGVGGGRLDGWFLEVVVFELYFEGRVSIR